QGSGLKARFAHLTVFHGPRQAKLSVCPSLIPGLVFDQASLWQVDIARIAAPTRLRRTFPVNCRQWLSCKCFLRLAAAVKDDSRLALEVCRRGSMAGRPAVGPGR